MNYVTDTHALVWYFQADKRLGSNALKAFEGTMKKGRIIVPTIVLAEIMYIARRGRILITFTEVSGYTGNVIFVMRKFVFLNNTVVW